MDRVREEINECMAKALVKNDFYLLNLARDRAKQYYELTPHDLEMIHKYEERLREEIVFIKLMLANEHFSGTHYRDNVYGIKLF
ncbi:MAG: hypothetical protein K0S80_5266 [Neobacillus sp.]|nr:hypothetical protein [Neobacillus sp.]